MHLHLTVISHHYYTNIYLVAMFDPNKTLSSKIESPLLISLFFHSLLMLMCVCDVRDKIGEINSCPFEMKEPLPFLDNG